MSGRGRARPRSLLVHKPHDEEAETGCEMVSSAANPPDESDSIEIETGLTGRMSTIMGENPLAIVRAEAENGRGREPSI